MGAGFAGANCGPFVYREGKQKEVEELRSKQIETMWGDPLCIGHPKYSTPRCQEYTAAGHETQGVLFFFTAIARQQNKGFIAADHPPPPEWLPVGEKNKT